MSLHPTHLGHTSAGQRLLNALKIGPNCKDIKIEMPAGGLFRMTVTRFLTDEEVAALAEYYETENLEMIPEGKTTYNLKLRSDNKQ